MPRKTGANNDAPKKQRLNPQQRAQRIQQIVFAVLGLIIVLTMILSLVYRY